MATHSSVLAWRIPGTGEPSGLPSLGSRRVGHDWSDLAAAAAGSICLSVSGLCHLVEFPPSSPMQLQMTGSPFLLLSNSIPLHKCGMRCVCVCTHTWHIFFNHSFVNGHLFLYLGYYDNAAINKNTDSLFEMMILFPLDTYSEVGLLDYSSSFNSLRNSRIVFHGVYSGSLSSTSLTILVVSGLFTNRLRSKCEVIFHCGFDSHFPD